jgi:O-antigen ligase
VKLSKEKFLYITDVVILVCLAIQISVASFFTALNSVSFGIWAGLWIIKSIYSKSIGISKEILQELKYFNIFIFLYFISEIISRIFALYPDGALNGLMRFLLLFIFYGAISKINSIEKLKNIILFILLILAAVSVYEIIRYVFEFGEKAKTYNIGLIRIEYLIHPITGAEIKMMILILFFPLLFIKEELIIKKLYLFLLLIPVFISMYLTQSRNVMLAVFFVMLIYGFLKNRKFLIGLIVLTLIIWFILPVGFQERILSIFDPRGASNYTRLAMWDVGLRIFLKFPFFGIGDNNIIDAYEMFKPAGYPGPPDIHSHLHSNYIMILVTTGAVGFIFYALFFIVIMRMQYKLYKNFSDNSFKALTLGCFLSLICLHISGIFEWNFAKFAVGTIFYFIMAIPFILQNINNIEKDKIH